MGCLASNDLLGPSQTLWLGPQERMWITKRFVYFSCHLKPGFRAGMPVLLPKTSLSKMAEQSIEQVFLVLNLPGKPWMFWSKQFKGTLELHLPSQGAGVRGGRGRVTGMTSRVTQGKAFRLDPEQAQGMTPGGVLLSPHGGALASVVRVCGSSFFKPEVVLTKLCFILLEHPQAWKDRRLWWEMVKMEKWIIHFLSGLDCTVLVNGLF